MKLTSLDLTFLATDPSHEHRGAATLLVRWGVEQAVRERVPAYLESTADAGPVYEKQEFKAVEKISMLLDCVEQNGAEVVYEETCYIFRPAATP